MYRLPWGGIQGTLKIGYYIDILYTNPSFAQRMQTRSGTGKVHADSDEYVTDDNHLYKKEWVAGPTQIGRLSKTMACKLEDIY